MIYDCQKDKKNVYHQFIFKEKLAQETRQDL